MTDDDALIEELLRQAGVTSAHLYNPSLFIKAAKAIRRQKVALAECHKEIFKLREALLSAPATLGETAT